MNKPTFLLKFCLLISAFLWLSISAFSYELIIEGDLSVNRTDNKLEAVFLDPDGNPAGLNESNLTWASSSTDMATIMQNGDVFFSGNTGTVTFTAVYETTNTTYTANKDFSYDPVDSRVYQLEIRDGLDYEQDTNQLTLYRVYSDNREEQINHDFIRWTTSDPKVATINNQGLVTFTKNAGRVTITADHRGRIASVSTTYPTEITEIVINESLQFTPAFFTDSPRLTVSARLNDGSVQRIQSPEWTSSNTDVATISNQGILALTGESGSTVVTATDNGHTDSRTLTVPDDQAMVLQRIFFTENLIYSTTGQSLQVNAVYDNNAVTNITDEVTFTVSNPALAEIQGNTLYYTGLSGNLTVTARYRNQTAVTEMFIYPLGSGNRELSGIRFQKSTYTIADNNKAMIVYGIRNDNSVFRISRPTFNVLERNVAEVRNGNLLFKGIPGSATIEASYGRFRDQVTAHNFRPEGALRPEGIYIASDITTGARIIPLVAYARYNCGNVENISSQAVWNVSNTNFAEINDLGQLEIKESQDFTVTVYYEGFSASVASRAYLFPNRTNGLNLAIIPINRIHENAERMMRLNSDLPYPPDIRGHWAERILRNAQVINWISGFPDGTIRPNQRITRAEFAVFADRIFDLTAPTDQRFSDTGNHWASASISKFKALNIYPMHSNTFRPNDPLTREEMADFIAKLGHIRNTNNNPYIDVNENNPYLQSILKVTQSGIMIGTDANRFSPKTTATRAQAMAVINNLLRTDPAMAAILR